MSAHTQNQASPGSAEEIFLTPRVVDRRAFETFAAMLRTSVEKATRESDLLARRAEAAASVLERLEGFVGAHTDIFQRASALIDTIDQRQRTAGDTLETLTRRTEIAQQAARDVEATVRERGEAFEARLATIAAGTLDSFEAARQSLSGDASTMRRDLSQRLDELRQRGESLIAALTERAERSGEDLAEQLTQLETARETLRVEHRETSRRLDEQAGELREGLRTESSAIKRELDAAARSLREAVAASSAHRDTIERCAELAVSRVQAGAGEQTLEVERISRRAEGLLREHRQSVESLSAELEARLESARDRAEAELGRVGEAARDRAKEIESALGARLNQAKEASASLDRLEQTIAAANELKVEIEGKSAGLEARIAELVERVCESQVTELHRENAKLRDELDVASSRLANLTMSAELRDERLSALEAKLAELLASRATEPAKVDIEPEPEPEPLIPVVVKPKPARKPAAKKAVTKKASTRKTPAKQGETESKPAPRTRKKASPKKTKAEEPTLAMSEAE